MSRKLTIIALVLIGFVALLVSGVLDIQIKSGDHVWVGGQQRAPAQ